MRRRLPTLIAVTALLALFGGLAVHRAMTDPAVVLLLPEAGAEWIRPDRPFDMSVHLNEPTTVEYQATFTVPPAYGGASLSVAGLRRVTVLLDDRPLNDVFDSDWKRDTEVALPASIPAGPHTLKLVASSPNGPALVRASCAALGLRTGTGNWGAAGLPAVRADLPWRPSIADRWGPSAPALWRCAPWLLATFALSAGIAWRRPAGDWGHRARWAVLAAWLLLGVADLYQVPLDIGYDAALHYDYVRYVADHARLPPPDAGPEFFQAPAFYVVSALLWRALSIAGASADQLPFLIRLVPLGCGVALAELCYRSARHAFPARPDLHAVAVVVAGCIPVNLYMGLAVSNEPMAGCLGGTVALAGIRFLARPVEAIQTRRLVTAGAVLGLAVLAKVSMGLWALPLAFAVGASAGRRAPRSLAIVAATSVLVCGPYLARTWLVAGTPVLTHALVHNTTWWQDPGYRTPANLLTFGRGLTRVAYGGIDSVWDSLYSTTWGNGFLSGMADYGHRSPWHADLMACGLWFGLVPTAAIAIGASCGRLKGGRWFPCASVALFGSAVAWVYLTLPIYSCAKASYLLSTLPCLAVLAAGGFDRVIVGRWSRAVVVGLLTCWAAVSYGTYVVAG